MSNKFNPTSTSGIGFHLEHFIQAKYLVAMITGQPFPLGGGDLTIKQLCFQAKHKADTDDLIVSCVGNGKDATYYVQSKKGFTVGKNETFTEVIKAAYSDFKQSHFVNTTDKIIITTDSLTNSDREDTLTMLEWARYSLNGSALNKKLEGNKKKYGKYLQFRSVLKSIEDNISDQEVWQFLKIIFLKEYDYLSIESRDTEILKCYLQPHLRVGVRTEDAINSILNYIIHCNQNAADVTIENIDAAIKSLFNFQGTNHIGPDLRLLMENSKRQIASTIFGDIGGYHLPRESYVLQISNAINHSKFVFLTGSGGVGKSSLTKDFIVSNPEYSCLYFKADTLDKPSLAEVLTAVGVKSSFEEICAQWQVFTRLIIFIDSFEKLYESESKEAFLELLHKVRQHPNITLIATCRIYALETLRTKYAVTISETIEISVNVLSEIELEAVAQEKPVLQRLISNPKLKNLISIPFYLSIAMRFSDMAGQDTIDERGFKRLLWEHVIEKKGLSKTGEGKKRGKEFSNLIIKRATERVPFISSDGMDIEILEQLYQEELLIKHPTLDLYAPSHDLVEDLVISRYLYHEYELRKDTNAFIQSLKLSPVIRRGLRFWIQDLNVEEPIEGQKLLHQTLQHFNKHPVVDEFLIGIISSENCLSILSTEREALLREDAAIFERLFHLAKLAFSVEYKGQQPLRKSKSIGPVWNALMIFYFENIGLYPQLQRFLDPLLVYWSLQFETGDEIPSVGRKVGMCCMDKIKAAGNDSNFDKAEDYLQMLFIVIPAYKEEVDGFLEYAYQLKANKTKEDSQFGFAIWFYRHLYEMILTKPYRCENIYKFFPMLVIDLAKLEWLSEEKPEDYSSDYQERSFGLQSYPYDYFSPSANQTPFQWLFKYNFDITLNFLIWLCNRAVPFYKESSYANDLVSIQVKLQDESSVVQDGNSALWATYRGEGNTPYLIQSALMAFEVALFEAASNGVDLAPIFRKCMIESHTVLLTGVFGSIALSHLSALGQEVLTLISCREFFRWDLTRYSSNLSNMHHTTIGNERYYTYERYLSNKLPHRKSHLENLLTTLQFYNAGIVNTIIDDFKKESIDDSDTWAIALERMDLRNTTSVIKEDEHIIEFTPKPLPKNIQKQVDDHMHSMEDTSKSSSVFVWANNALASSIENAPTYEEWQLYLKKYKTINFNNISILNPVLMLEAIAVKFFPEKLQEEEARFCTDSLVVHFNHVVLSHVTGEHMPSVDVMEKSIYTILPKLLCKSLASFIDTNQVKSIISDLLLLRSHSEEQLIEGIRSYLWEIDEHFAEYCFKIFLKNTINLDIYKEVYRSQMQDINSKDIFKLINERKKLEKDEIVFIDLNCRHKVDLIFALNMLPLRLLSTTHFKYLQEIFLNISLIFKKTSRKDYSFEGQLSRLTALLLISEHNNNTKELLWNVLDLLKTYHKITINVFECFLAFAHDRNYPNDIWNVFNNVWDYIITRNARIAFVCFLLFSYLKQPLRANQLLETNSIRAFYKKVITKFAGDKNVIDSVFKFLTGVGKAYQFEALEWLRISIPNRESYIKAMSEINNIMYFDEYMQQLYDKNIAEIKRNRKQLEYYGVILDILIDKGSQTAFKLRDSLI